VTGDRRRRAVRRGRSGEAAAALWLRCKGYRILGRRVKTPVGEIDILARKGSVLAVVEVKARPTTTAATEAIGIRQRRRIERAAAWVLSSRPELAQADVRFDAVLVTPFRPPRHVVYAWRPDF